MTRAEECVHVVGRLISRSLSPLPLPLPLPLGVLDDQRPDEAKRYHASFSFNDMSPHFMRTRYVPI